MWTEEKLKEAAEKYYHERVELVFKRRYTTLEEAFLAGCKYIINNTQKENESKARKETNDNAN